MAPSFPVVIEENWETYVTESEGHPVFITFYTGANELPQDDFPYCARIMVPIKEPNEGGGPTGDEAERLNRLEDELTAILTKNKVDCVMVARLTHDGTREMVFQVADWDRFRPPVGAWMQRITDYELDVSEHDGWGFFEDCVWPSDVDWMLINDRRVVDNLISGGSNPEREHSLEYVFLGDDEQLQELKKELANRDYVEMKESEEPGQLLMTKKLPLDLGQIWNESLENRALCEKLGVEFDGWGAAIVK